MTRRTKFSHSISKGASLTVEIVDFGNDGEGVARHEGIPIFIPGGIPGEHVSITIESIHPNFCRGRITLVQTPSAKRCNPPCSIFGLCGGCHIQHLNYSGQLAWKTEKVRRAIEHIGKLPHVSIRNTIGMETPFYYRNKILIPLAKSAQGKVVAGFFKTGSHDVVAMDDCLIQDRRFKPIIDATIQFLTEHSISIYNETSHSGIARAILAKCSDTEMVVHLIINADTLPSASRYCAMLQEINGVTGIGIIINKEKTNVPVTDQIHTLWGSLDLTYRFNNLVLKAPGHGFFQVNTQQTNRLLSLIKSIVTEPIPVAFDLYCGVGTLGLAIAPFCTQLLGNEWTPIAVQYAKKNAQLNHLNHCTFEAGDAPKVTQRWVNQGLRPTLVIVDPPRKGCSVEMIELLIQLHPQKIIYVSCDPATLARDLRHLSPHFSVEWVQPVDMFPQTGHVESVAYLTHTSTL